jgi:hypothetical protein
MPESALRRHLFATDLGNIVTIITVLVGALWFIFGVSARTEHLAQQRIEDLAIIDKRRIEDLLMINEKLAHCETASHESMQHVSEVAGDLKEIRGLLQHEFLIRQQSK